MSTTTTEERVRAVVRNELERWLVPQYRHTAADNLVDALAAAGLLRGDDDLPAGLRAELVDLLCDAGTSSIRLEYPGKWHARRMALLRVLTGAGASEAPAKPTRRMQAQGLKPHHNFEHQEVETCAVFPPCQPVAEPAPVEDRPLVVGDVIDFIDEHGNEWTRSRRVEAWLAATPAPCRHPGAVAVETVVDHSILTSTGRVVERVTTLYCPGCGARIAVPQEVSHG